MRQDLSMLTPQSWKYAGGNVVDHGKYAGDRGYGIIVIIPNLTKNAMSVRNDLRTSAGDPVKIVGVMNKPLSLGMKSEWVEMSQLNAPFVSQGMKIFDTALNDTSTLAGNGAMAAVWASKKLWKQSGFVDLNLEFTIVDWNGDGAPKRMAEMLYRLQTAGPKTGTQDAALKVEEFLRGGVNGVVDVLKTKTDFTDQGASTGNEALAAGGAALDMVGDAMGVAASMAGNVANTIIEDLADTLALRDSAVPVRIIIGNNFFDHADMVVNNVSCTFSKEMSPMGPLRVDISMDVSSRKLVAGYDEIGFKHNSNKQRVAVLDPNFKDSKQVLNDIFGE